MPTWSEKSEGEKSTLPHEAAPAMSRPVSGRENTKAWVSSERGLRTASHRCERVTWHTGRHLAHWVAGIKLDLTLNCIKKKKPRSPTGFNTYVIKGKKATNLTKRIRSARKTLGWRLSFISPLQCILLFLFFDGFIHVSTELSAIFTSRYLLASLPPDCCLNASAPQPTASLAGKSGPQIHTLQRKLTETITK